MRASEIVDLIRDSSRRWSDRISRWRARLFNLTADEEASESSSLVSWPTSASLFSSSSCRFVSVLSSSSEGFWGMFGAAANCEYVWKSVSVWQTVLALYLRRCRDYLPAARGRALVGALASILRLWKPWCSVGSCLQCSCSFSCRRLALEQCVQGAEAVDNRQRQSGRLCTRS